MAECSFARRFAANLYGNVVGLGWLAATIAVVMLGVVVAACVLTAPVFAMSLHMYGQLMPPEGGLPAGPLFAAMLAWLAVLYIVLDALYETLDEEAKHPL